MEGTTVPRAGWSRQKKWKWTFILLTVFGVIFYIVGGALLGASVNGGSCRTSGYYYGGYYYYGSSYNCVNYGLFYAGVAFIVISAVISLLWLIFLILRFTSWYKKGLYQAPVAYQQSQYGVTTSAPAAPAPVAAPYGHTEKVAEPTAAPATEAPPTSLCLHCEHPTAGGAFCTNCGKAQ